MDCAAISTFFRDLWGVYILKIFMKPDMAATRGILDIGISLPTNRLLISETKIIDWDSFLEGAKGIDGVTELSTKIWLSSTLDFFDNSERSS